MALRPQVEYGLVRGSGDAMRLWGGVLLFALAPSLFADEDVLSQFDTARAEINLSEKSQREIMAGLFEINQRIKSIAKKQAQLNGQMLEVDGQARDLAQQVAHAEESVVSQRDALNSHLRQLYQSRKIDAFQWLFSAKSPNELERHFRFLRKFLNMDHELLNQYISSLQSLKERRLELSRRVRDLKGLQQSIAREEQELAREQTRKSKMLRAIRVDRTKRIAALKGLREKHSALNDIIEYAFFEKRGELRPPVDVAPTRGFGTYVDSEFHFRLAHKGLFYSLPAGRDVRVIADGTVVFAQKVSGYEALLIVDHGDNYYSVYAHVGSLRVKNADKVRANDVVALSGSSSPLFGPGLYFEVRHFSDAIDPKPWFKDSTIQTASVGPSIEAKETE